MIVTFSSKMGPIFKKMGPFSCPVALGVYVASPWQKFRPVVAFLGSNLAVPSLEKGQNKATMKLISIIAVFVAAVVAQNDEDALGQICTLAENALLSQFFWPTSESMDNSDENRVLQDCSWYDDSSCCNKFFTAFDYDEYFRQASGGCLDRVRQASCAVCAPNQEQFINLVGAGKPFSSLSA